LSAATKSGIEVEGAFMIRSILALAASALMLGACATTQGTDTVRNDDAYVPIGSNIPRKDRKPEERASSTMPPGAYIPGPTAGPRN
jgi:hypothetical protein